MAIFDVSLQERTVKYGNKAYSSGFIRIGLCFYALYFKLSEYLCADFSHSSGFDAVWRHRLYFQRCECRNFGEFNLCSIEVYGEF